MLLGLKVCGKNKDILRCMQVLPVENIEGRREWEGGSLCLRKTPGGVDLNRNYPFAWRKEVGATC